MYKHLLLFLIILGYSSTGIAQQKGFPDYHPPLGIDPLLASNFGELRPNHFHMGLDYKTNGKIGYNLYSIEEGFVSRIKVSPYGYGKVIYIDHPNGITSVYAHCSEFKGQIDSIVRAVQIAEQNFAVEVFPKQNEIKVSKGQIIGISGNTGGSTAPHLHFELRDTKTEHGLNPLVYGFDMEDHKAPEIRNVKVYGLTKDGYRYPGKNKVLKTVKSGSEYVVSGNTFTIPASYATQSGGVGFAFDVIDRLDGAPNRCGLYGSVLIVNGDTLFGQETNRIPFESTRYVNCHKDYEEYSVNSRRFHKCFRTRENDLPIYLDPTGSLGILKVTPGTNYTVNYIGYDAKGNQSILNFTLVVSPGEMGADERLMDDLSYLQPAQPMRVKEGSTELDFGVGTVYEPMKIDQAKIGWSVGERDTPVHSAYKIIMEAPTAQDGKDYIEIVTAKGKRRTLPVIYDGEHMICESKYFGNYKLKRDTIAPSLTSVNVTKGGTIVGNRSLQWKISDGQTGVADCDMFIDGQWVLLEYEYKTGVVTHQRNPSITGKKEVLVRLVDDCGNSSEWKSELTFN